MKNLFVSFVFGNGIHDSVTLEPHQYNTKEDKICDSDDVATLQKYIEMLLDIDNIVIINFRRME